jgi:PAS domain S-box-containing protein
MGLWALIIAALGAAAIFVFVLLVPGLYFPKTLNRYCKRSKTSIVGLFVLAAVIPVTVLGISGILFINYHLSRLAEAPALEFWLNAASVAVVLLTAFVAALFAIILARRITLPLSDLLSKAEVVAGKPFKEPKGTGGTLNTMAEVIGRAADELSSARDYTNNIISSVADALVVVDGQWRVKTANRAFLELLGYCEKDVTGRPFDGFCEKGHFKELLYEGLIRQGGIKDLELFLSAADGEKIPVAISASPVMGRDGEFVILVRDLRGLKLQKKSCQKG